ncbi:MAG: hypothetical protein H7239_06050 [Flavobacterium sp.]|nr:hypothetical protein [Flavobacterium sp.]
MNRDQKYRNQENPAPHSGQLLTTYFKEKRTRKSALARVLNRRPDTIYGYEKNSTIQTAILWELCHALQYNFFADIAAQLPASYATKSALTTQADKIAQLEQEISTLNREKNLLLEALKKA